MCQKLLENKSEFSEFQDKLIETISTDYDIPSEVLRMPFESNYSASREWLNTTYEELNKARDILSGDSPPLNNTPKYDPYELSTIPEETLEVGDIMTIRGTDEWEITKIYGKYKIKNIPDIYDVVDTICIKEEEIEGDWWKELYDEKPQFCEIGEEDDGLICKRKFVRKGVK